MAARSRYSTVRSVVPYVVATLMIILMLFPVLTLLRASVMSRIDLNALPVRWLPDGPFAWSNYTDVLEPDHVVPLTSALANSFIVALGAALLASSVGSLAAYALLRFQWRWRHLLLTGIFSLYILPGILFLIPLFIVYRTVGLLDTRTGLVLLYAGFITPFVIVIVRSFLATFPVEMEEAAYIDGCTPFQAFIRIVIPVGAPGFVAAFIAAFIFGWNEFLVPLILTSRLRLVTTSLGLYTSTQDIELGHMAVASLYSIVPVLVLAIGFQRYIRRGLAEGGVRG